MVRMTLVMMVILVGMTLAFKAIATTGKGLSSQRIAADNVINQIS